jgi:hypothetical protein
MLAAIAGSGRMVRRCEHGRVKTPSRVVTIRPTKSAVLGIRGHVLWIETESPDGSSSMDIPVEGSVIFVLVVIADIVLLAICSRFATVPRELVRWIGGAFLALVALWALMFAVIGGLISLIRPGMASLDGRASRIPIKAFVAVAVVAVALGALLGTSAVIGVPAEFAPDALLLVASGWVWRGRGRPARWPAGRHLFSAGLALAGCSGVVIGVLLLQHA